MTARPVSKARVVGPGRRAVDGSTQVERVTITLTEADRVKLRQLGGSPWVRASIRRASVGDAVK